MKILAPLALIIILGFAVYINSLGGGFIWDDTFLVRDNAYIKSPFFIQKIFTENIGSGAGKDFSFYRPLQLLSYMLDYSLWRLDVRGFHLMNLLLHILTALCIFWFINTLYDDRLLSFLTGILFVLHPIQTEAVAYISGRAESLAAIFIFLSLILYIRQLSIKSKPLYILMILSYIAALLSKESSLILPLLLVLYHYIFKKRLEIKRFLPVLGIAFIYILLRLTVLRSFLYYQSYPAALLQRIPGFFVAITNYLRLLVLPFNLHMEYVYTLFKFNNPQAILGALALVSLLIYAFVKRKTNRLISFSIFWFFLTLLPVSNIYPINAHMAEHWLYLPSTGFFIILAGFLCYIYRRRNLRLLAAVSIIGLLSFYSFLTIRQNNYWKDPLAFYKRTLEYVPESPRVHTNLGSLYKDTGRHREAMASYKKAIAIDPNCALAYYNLGIIYKDIGKEEEALSLFKKAIEIDPDYIEAYNNLGGMFMVTARHKEAIAIFKKALKINPNHAKLHNNLAGAYYYQKQYALAIKHCDKAIELGSEVNPEFLKLLKPYRR